MGRLDGKNGKTNGNIIGFWAVASCSALIDARRMDTYIILLNWNGWRDTVECLESLFRLDEDNFRIIVCDNASTDDSLEQIKRWAEGEIQVRALNEELDRFCSPAVRKPVAYCEVSNTRAGRSEIRPDVRLILMQTGGNLGFAGGNNVGLRFALKDRDCRFCWLLNSDTVVAPEALTALRRAVEENPAVGICGSLNLSYHSPKEVQALGGKSYNYWTSRVRALPTMSVDQLPAFHGSFDFVNGASMFVTRRFLERVGLMEESYFLYFEELDWAMRSKGRFLLGYAPDSVIYHKEGAQAGSHSDRTKRSLLSDQFLTKNRVLFTRRYLPWALPSVLATVVLAAGYRLLLGDPKRARVMLASMFKGLRNHARTAETA
jgi:GT2 family glycosyltransferase